MISHLAIGNKNHLQKLFTTEKKLATTISLDSKKINSAYVLEAKMFDTSHGHYWLVTNTSLKNYSTTLTSLDMPRKG